MEHRQGDVAADVNAAVGATNQAITDSEELFNDSLEAANGALQNFAGQALNGAGALANLVTGGAAAAPAAPAADAGRLQQNLADAATTATNDASTLAADAATIATDSANVAADLGSQFVNTATNFIGGLAGGNAAQRLQQGNLATDINTLNQAALGAIGDFGNTLTDAAEQTEMIANNVIGTTEQAFGAAGATVANPDRLQQDPTATAQTVTDDATDVAQDLATATNDGIQAFNDLTQQGIQAFNGLFAGATGAAPAGGRRLQRFN